MLNVRSSLNSGNLSRRRSCQVRASRVGLATGQPLPVHPYERTSSDRPSWSVSCQNRNWPVSSAGFSFLRNLRMVGRPGLPRGKRSDQADDFRVVFLRLLAYPSTAPFADYLLLELEPIVAEAAAAGGGIMFHVSARYFQSAPSCTTTLMYVPVTCWPPTSAAQVPA